MTINIKTFEALTKSELYNILQLRSEVFVVEQDCVYQDIDGLDEKAIHVMGFKQQQLVAYTRIFKPGDYFEEASIGRVVVKKEERKFGFGKLARTVPFPPFFSKGIIFPTASLTASETKINPWSFL